MNTASEEIATDQALTAPLRFITAASLFDGHDAAINIIRRILLAHGAEVVHLGHNRSVADIVRAAIQEDADGIAVSSYQGGHNEYFRYMVDQLRENNAEHIRLVVGGGGTIAPDEIKALESYGVEKIYTPDDGVALGLVGMIDDVFTRVRAWPRPNELPDAVQADNQASVARLLSYLEKHGSDVELPKNIISSVAEASVIGVTGTGGAGKSSLTDELLTRVSLHFPDAKVAVLAVDPTRRRTGGALLGDRIRMNSLSNENIFMRSLATRQQHQSTSAILEPAIKLMRRVGFDLVVVETAGIGQSDSSITDMVDLSLYVMTSEYGAASQLEKIDMLDLADIVAINKFEKRGSEDALRDVRKQWKRNHTQFDIEDDAIPVYPTIASHFNDPGINRLFTAIVQKIAEHNDAKLWQTKLPSDQRELHTQPMVPIERQRYLAEIANGGRSEAERIEQAAQAASRAYACYQTLQALDDEKLPALYQSFAGTDLETDKSLQNVRQVYQDALQSIGDEHLTMLRAFPERVAAARTEHYSYQVRDREHTGENYTQSLSQLSIPKIAVPNYRDWGDQLRFIARENLPGDYPYTAGVYPYRREQEDPIRMFAGEGPPERTNRRFHLLSNEHAATRLSTAFDSVTLYGEDPDERPDIYGRIGNSGVSIATLDDMKKLYSGFDLCSPTTSVSMTINGPAPMILAMFLNTAIDQQVEKHLKDNNQWAATERKIAKLTNGNVRPNYEGEKPETHDGFGLGTLGVTGDQLVDAKIYEKIKAQTLSKVRGTVQADIFKEDQAQNTCIFSTEFALRMMGDVQAYFTDNQVRNFYSVSVSGYHIAEAGANPITQLAFTLSNGFTLVEYYLSRGMSIDEFAPNLSFFFSNGMDPEYAVIGRVARRIWARAMKHRYGAEPRSQMLKYHIQTSGRSLHAQEIQFNDIRTTLQALYALFDSCNSLHTNAYDEAITTPTEESVRRALAIQLIINKELGLNRTQNPWQGSFIIDELTDLVEEAVYQEFERLSERGGVLGAMELMYQRSKIQDESLYYEERKMDGRLPIVGVNTFFDNSGEAHSEEFELIRSTETEKQQQVQATHAFQTRHQKQSTKQLQQLQAIARDDGNVFAELIEAVKTCSLGQITHALYDVGGRYRRAM
ncbi:MAG: methylmalonyl-CoA mutase family protein [Gammaproteobacteria bacterium]|nr:methylmalonyl-CoA mutase family protein [Gammaproteobacteria bacterium]